MMYIHIIMYVYYYVYYVCTCKQLATFIITFIPKRNYFNDALVLLILASNTNPLNIICIKRRICVHVLAMVSWVSLKLLIYVC